MELLEQVETRRNLTLVALDPGRHANLGQFYTNAPTADLIASLLCLDGLRSPVRVLDPDAGIGSHATALAARIRRKRQDLAMEITAVELDENVLSRLAQTLRETSAASGAKTTLVQGNYIADLAQETETWMADASDRMIHRNGNRFLGPDPFECVG